MLAARLGTLRSATLPRGFDRARSPHDAEHAAASSSATGDPYRAEARGRPLRQRPLAGAPAGAAGARGRGRVDHGHLTPTAAGARAGGRDPGGAEAAAGRTGGL